MISSTPIFKSKIFSDWLVYNDETHNEYLVTVDYEDNTVNCDCPDFKFRRQTEKWGGAKIDDPIHHCKHIKEVLHE